MSLILIVFLLFILLSVCFFLFYKPIVFKSHPFRSGELRVYRPDMNKKKVNKRLLFQTWND